MKTHLSKSVALSGRQCVKLLFRELHEPQLAAQVKVTDRLPSRGLEVHENARRQYPDEILFRQTSMAFPYLELWLVL